MADKKLTELVLGHPGANSLVYGVVDPGSVPASKKFAWPGQGYNVRDWGAVGDGVTDDTQAFQDIAAAIASNPRGGAVYVPAGYYIITETIKFDLSTESDYWGLVFSGDGSSTKIHYTTADGTDAIWVLGAAGGTTVGVVFRDFFLLGAGSGSATGEGIRLQRCIAAPLCQNLFIRHFGGGAGIYVESSWMTNIQNCKISACKYGITVTDDPVTGNYGWSNNTVIQNTEVLFSTNHGIWVPDCNSGGYTISGLTIRDCIIEGNEGSAMVLYGVQGLNITNIYTELNKLSITTYGDIHLMKCIFGYIALCKTAGGMTGDVFYADGDSYDLVMFCNNWQDTTSNLSGPLLSFRGIDTSSATAYPSSYFNNIAHNSTSGVTFSANDATPAVNNPYAPAGFKTANTLATTITNFDNGWEGLEFTVLVDDANTTFDFSSSSLRGNGGVDFAAASGDAVRFIKHGNYWYGTVYDIA